MAGCKVQTRFEDRRRDTTRLDVCGKMLPFCTVLVLCFVAVLSGPVPEFGLPLPIAGSSQVRDSATQAHDLLRTVTDRLNVTLTSNYARLPTTLTLLATIATFTESIDRAVIAPVLALVRDSSGDVRVSFQPVLEGISSTQSYIQQQLPIDLARLEASISHYVPDRLSDGFRCVRSGLERLAGGLETLRGAMLEAVKEAGTASVSAPILKNDLIPRGAPTLLTMMAMTARRIGRLASSQEAGRSLPPPKAGGSGVFIAALIPHYTSGGIFRC
uniref:Protein TsetseEP domain-containing protein n=1 Tax=Anopheles farauti TaxID=69004 RepID=A0A182R0H9_9DIPT